MSACQTERKVGSFTGGHIARSPGELLENTFNSRLLNFGDTSSSLIPASISACGENLFKRWRDPIGNSHLYHQRPDMTKILLKGRKIASHQSIITTFALSLFHHANIKLAVRCLYRQRHAFLNTRTNNYAHVHTKLHN